MTDVESVPKARPVRLWMSIWAQVRRADRIRLAVAAAAMIAAGVLTAILPVAVGGLVDHALARGGETHASVGFSQLAGGLLDVAVLVVASQLLNVLRRQLVESVKTSFERDSRHLAYVHLLHLDLDRLRKGLLGGIYGRTSRSIEGAVRLLQLGAMDLLPALTLAICALLVAVTRDALVAVAMSLVIPTGFALVAWQVRSQEGVRIALRHQKEEIDGEVVELLPSMETIRALGGESHASKRIAQACERLRSIELRHHRAMSLFDAVKVINEGLWLLITLGIAIERVGGADISAGQLTAYVLLYAGVTAPLRELHRIVDEASESAQQTSDYFELLDAPLDESYLPAPEPTITTTARSGAPEPAAKLTNVRFCHDRGDAVLDGVTLTLAQGERIGLVGRTGSGKSTLLKLLVRAHHGYDGTIEIAGHDLRALGRERLAETIGYLPQEARLFRRSVFENIAFAAPGASPQQVYAAARKANVHDDIVSMRDGYRTIVGERGDTLSGGQRQRICLARTLLRRPPLLLLDEYTSAVDGAAQAAIQRTIDALEEVSVIAVAHRLRTLRTMHRIVVLDGGRIVEEGAFNELAKRDGIFARMLLSETSEPADKPADDPADEPANEPVDEPVGEPAMALHEP